MICIFVEILTEPNFEESSWGKAIYDNLNAALLKKKINFCKILDHTQLEKKTEPHFLMVIGSDEKWLNHIISICGDKKIHPILLGGAPQNSYNGIFSSVTSDINRSMYYLINHLKQKGKTKPALYGINPASLPNLTRKDSFLLHFGNYATENDVYYNNGSLKKCFKDFFINATKYDCVICANDYSAISLLQNLNKQNFSTQNLLIVSYGDTFLSKRFSDSLLTISMCYDEYGKAAVSICETLNKNPALLYINIAVKWKINKSNDFSKNELPDTPHLEDITINEAADNLFYSDTEMSEMILLENMLCACDTLDLKLINLILNGNSYEKAAELCFISQNTAKYRIKKLMNICKTTSKKAFLDLIKKYY